MGEPEQMGQQQSLISEAKEKAKQKAREGLQTASTQVGQKVGSLAQALRMSGEQLRGQGQEGQAKLVDGAARRAQAAGGYLSQSDSDSLMSDAKQGKEKVKERTQQVRQQAGSKVREQVDSRRPQAGEKVSSLAQALRSTSENLRGQGEETQAKVVDRLAERAERMGGYLSQSDADKIMSDLRGYAQRAKEAFSRRKQTVAEKQKSVTSKGTGAVKRGATRVVGAVRQKPVRFAAGALLGGLLAARRALKSDGQGEEQPVQAVETQPAEMVEVEPAESVEYAGLTKRELMERARVAGIPVRETMTKTQLIEALRTERVEPSTTTVLGPTSTPVDEI